VVAIHFDVRKAKSPRRLSIAQLDYEE